MFYLWFFYNRFSLSVCSSMDLIFFRNLFFNSRSTKEYKFSTNYCRYEEEKKFQNSAFLLLDNPDTVEPSTSVWYKICILKCWLELLKYTRILNRVVCPNFGHPTLTTSFTNINFWRWKIVFQELCLQYLQRT